ncbi:hypothetical protein G114_16255 [Aeromonas diversa CDC 2478-85]|uniref:Uncharacterized protein n=1 Tax=Aeromonas diversa CDC 2478-85 TaxID=1268237 RepID=N9TXH8_9GAMM|nr:hypothetical protein G114_16255 [Aeromonas diversa CDC 2478-85]
MPLHRQAQAGAPRQQIALGQSLQQGADLQILPLGIEAIGGGHLAGVELAAGTQAPLIEAALKALEGEQPLVQRQGDLGLGQGETRVAEPLEPQVPVEIERLEGREIRLILSQCGWLRAQRGLACRALLGRRWGMGEPLIEIDGSPFQVEAQQRGR